MSRRNVCTPLLPILIAMFVVLGLTCVQPASATKYIAEPILVTQPAYNGMSFYVYRPPQLPAGWFVTFDGYPVLRASTGVWVYGRPDGQAIMPTGYVVGSVVPTEVHLVPLQQTVPPQGGTVYSVPAPQWGVAPTLQVPQASHFAQLVQNPNFRVVTNWTKLVDRMGVLDKPRVPIAWKGDRPKVVFAWTGRSWYEMKAPEGGLSPARVIKRRIYSLTRMVNENGFHWNDSDTAALANQATIWGFLWMGHLAPINL